MGKTVTAEFAVNYPGKTRNPFDATRTPAALPADRLRQWRTIWCRSHSRLRRRARRSKPGSFCGVFAHRPTFGDVRCSGVMESAASCDTVGLYARTVEDIALHRDVLIGVGPMPLPDDFPAPRIGFVRPPQMNIPAFKGPNGLPVGAQVIAAAGADRMLFSAARWMHARLLKNRDRATTGDARRWP